jgi:hypothetical protein
MSDAVLTRGEWESLRLQVPDQVKGLVVRLGIHHGVFERPTPEECPVCGQHVDEPRQEALFAKEK